MNCEDAVYAGVWSFVCVRSENRVEEITYFGPPRACHIVQIYGEYTPIPLIGGFAQAERQKVHPSRMMLVCYIAVFMVVTRGGALRDDTKTAVQQTSMI